MKKTFFLTFLSLWLIPLSYSQVETRLDSNPLLTESWNKFISAVKKSDITMLKLLCADSVKFSMYMGNQEIFASGNNELNENDYEKKNAYSNYFYMPQESFVTEELPYVFDNNVISRMDDLSMLRVIKANDSDFEYQVLITISDPDDEIDGAEMGLRFKKEKGTFLLCGIDTVQ